METIKLLNRFAENGRSIGCLLDSLHELFENISRLADHLLRRYRIQMNRVTELNRIAYHFQGLSSMSCIILVDAP